MAIYICMLRKYYVEKMLLNKYSRKPSSSHSIMYYRDFAKSRRDPEYLLKNRFFLLFIDQNLLSKVIFFLLFWGKLSSPLASWSISYFCSVLCKNSLQKKIIFHVNFMDLNLIINLFLITNNKQQKLTDFLHTKCFATC